MSDVRARIAQRLRFLADRLDDPGEAGTQAGARADRSE